MNMALPSEFINYENFELAFTRICRGLNKSYKQFYAHLFSSYNLALKENLTDLIKDIKMGTFEPGIPTIIFLPKQSGILRPITLLSLKDLIVYQAIVNVIADKFMEEQNKYALWKSFGHIYAGKDSPFFFRSWKVCYKEYNKAMAKAYIAGNSWVADFDLVSFYDLIDHGLLRNFISTKVKNRELVDLLLCCLNAWTTNSNKSLKHGIPQGPESSSFLAECFLFYFDANNFGKVRYLRYVDDIRLMAKEETPLRRALLKLDLGSKELGLVPQAQKISVRKIDTIKEILKKIPSPIAAETVNREANYYSQKELLNIFRKSLVKEKKEWIIKDFTNFKFSLIRLNPKKDVLKRIVPLLNKRPDCSSFLSLYLKKFSDNQTVAEILFDVLRQDPTYDAAAADYIEAMDICEPLNKGNKYRRIIQTANRRSEEKSILLPIASLTFTGRRCGPKDAMALIENETNPIIKGILIHRLFGNDEKSLYKTKECEQLLKKEVNGDNPDLARLCASLLLSANPNWYLSRTANHSVKLLMLGLGIRKRAPNREGILDTFFKKKMMIRSPISWKKALGEDFQDAEQRCLELQKRASDPDSGIMILDTFNEVLLQSFSKNHPSLSASYRQNAGKNLHPDLGNWLRNKQLQIVLSSAIPWFQDVHNTRVGARLAHAKNKSGNRKGKRTRGIGFKKWDKLLREATLSWNILINQWTKIN